MDPDQGIIGADSLDKSRLASPYVHHPSDIYPLGGLEPGTILGYPVHVRCWDFLLVHKLGAFVENHLPAILHALRQQYNDFGWTMGPNTGKPKQFDYIVIYSSLSELVSYNLSQIQE